MAVSWRSTIYTLQGIVGIFANIVVVMVILRSTALRKIYHMKLIMNQSLIDATASLCLIFSYLNLRNMGVQLSFNHGGPADWMLCFFYHFDRPMWGFFISSTANLLMMTIMKYLQIVHPIWYKTTFTITHLRTGIAICWISGPLYVCATFAGRVKVIDGKCNLSVWSNQTVGITIGVIAYMLQLLVPLVVFVFCYARMFMVIRQRWNQVAPGDETGQAANPSAPIDQNKQNQITKNTRVQKNIVVTLLTVSLCFIVCWVLRTTQFLLENLGLQDGTKNYGGFIHEFGVLAIFTNILINPFIYLISLKNFREAAKEVFCKKGQHI